MEQWLSNALNYGIVGVVILFGLAVFYKALKEPIDLILGALGKGISSLFGKISGASATVTETISYD